MTTRTSDTQTHRGLIFNNYYPINNVCVFVCVCLCVCLMAGKSKAAASGRWRRRRTQDTMAKPTAQHARQQLAGGPRTRPLNKLKVHHSLQPPPPPSSRHRCRSRRRPPRQIPATRAVSRVAEPRRTSSSISTSSTSSTSSSSSTRERRAPAALTQPAIRLPCAIDARRPPRRAPRSLLDDQRSPIQQCRMMYSSAA